MSTRATVFPSDVRRALLFQHQRLRKHLSVLDALAKRILAGEAVDEDFLHAVDELRAQLEEHNALEEKHLEPLLRSADAWGPQRVEQMASEHGDEHRELRAVLDETDVPALARAMLSLLDKLRAHMKREEESFLSSEVLHDDLVTLGPSS